MKPDRALIVVSRDRVIVISPMSDHDFGRLLRRALEKRGVVGEEGQVFCG